MEKKLKEMQEIGINVKELDKEKTRENTPSRNVWVKEGDKEPYFKKLSLFYWSLMKKYVSTLAKRASMEESVYEKLISDLIHLRKKGFRVQRKNQFSYLDSKKGFVFIEPYESNSISDEDFIRDAFTILFGNGLPAFYVGFECHNLITKALQYQLDKSVKKCVLRLSEVLERKGFSHEVIMATMADCLAEIDKEPMVIEAKDMASSMKNFYNTTKKQSSLKMV